MQAAVHRSYAVAPPIRLDVVWKTIAAALVVALLSVVLVTFNPTPATGLDGRPASVWLSGEARARVVLVGARSERPSIAIGLGDTATSYDIADVGANVMVHDRTTGTIVVVDARDGSEVRRIVGPLPLDEQRLLVDAGTVAYVVDPTASTVARLGSDASELVPVTIEHGFTDWVGTSDGVLWLTNDADGTYTSFDGSAVSRTRLTSPGANLELTSSGSDPVVFDRTSGRLRWVRRNLSVEVSPPNSEAGAVVIQSSDPNPDDPRPCVTILSRSTLSCLTPDETVRTATVIGIESSLGMQLVADDVNAVITRASDPTILVATWATGGLTTASRSEPSSRATLGTSITGTIVIDDPGSQFAFSVDENGDVLQLDKFSKRTVVISANGSDATGLGALDDGAEVAGAFADQGATAGLEDISGVNDPPVAGDDDVTTRIGRAVTIAVLANDIDPENEPMIVASVDSIPATDGTVSILDGSKLHFIPPDATPNEVADRVVSFDYRVEDLERLDDDATVEVTIIGSDRNTAPNVVDDRAMSPVNGNVDIAVLANDSDQEGDPLSIVGVTSAAHGSAAIGANGRLRYQPDLGFVGSDRFTYEVTDGFGGSGIGTVDVDVAERSPINRPPNAGDDRSSTTSGQRIRVQVLANDSDPDGDALEIVDVSTLTNVELTVVGGSTIDVLPQQGVAGLVRFTYTIADPLGLRDTATVGIFIGQANLADPPIAVDDEAQTAATPVQIDVIANDKDPSGGQLAVESWSQPATGAGTVDRVSPTTLRYTPALGFVGSAEFGYTVRSVAGLTASARVRVVVTPATGSGPVAHNDQAQGFVGEVVRIAPLANDEHSDNLPFDYAGPPVVRAGSATINSDRTISFTPPPGTGTYELKYTIQDSNLRQSSATIGISIIERPLDNRAPQAINDLYSTPFGTAAIFAVMDNDGDPDSDSVRLVAVGPASSGVVERSGNRARFTPEANFSGLASFPYTIADARGLTSSAQVTILVTDRIRVVPVAANDLVSLITGTATTVNPLQNDSDPDGLPGTLAIGQLGTPNPAGVTASVVGSSVRIVAGSTPGTYQIPYTVVDSDGQAASATIVVVVQAPPNSQPIATNDNFPSLGLAGLFPVLENDQDPDGGTITLVSVGSASPSSAGVATVSGRQVAFSPNPSFSGVVNIPYSIRDGQGGSASAVLSITVTACPAVPSLSPVSATTRYATPIVALALFGSSGVPAGATVSIGSPSAGTAVLSTTGATVAFTPPTTFNGIATFSYSARTICNAVATSTVSITVNRTPVARDDVATTTRNRAVVVPVLDNDSDPDSDALTVQSVSNSVNGSATITAGVVTFTPTANFSGTGSFTYRIVDIGGLFDTANVRVTVSNQAPVAVNDTTTSPTLTPTISYNVITNDTDPNLDVLTLASVGSVSPSTAGTAAASGNSIVFTPRAGLGPGLVTVAYTVSDGLLASSGLLSITITNRPPVAAADSGAINLAVSDSVTVAVKANDADPDGVDATIVLVSATVRGGPSVGSVAAITTLNQSVVFTTAITTSGIAFIDYVIRDSFGDTSIGVLTVTITAAPPPTTTTTTTTTTAPP